MLVSKEMGFRDFVRKYQRDSGFMIAWGSAYLSAWVMVRPLAWIAGGRWTGLFEVVEYSALVAISIAVLTCMIRSAIIKRRSPRGEPRKYPSVSFDQVLDLYLRFMATAAATAVPVLIGLFGLQHLHWLNSKYAVVVLVVGFIAGWIVWVLAGRSLRPYPLG